MGDVKVGPLSLPQLVVIIGAIIGIIAIFINWFSWDMGIIGKLEFTGWDFAFDKDKPIDGFQGFCPFIAWILMIISLVCAVLPLLKVELPKFLTGVGFILFGLLAIIFTVIWGVYQEDVVLTTIKMFDYAAAGVWMMIVGAALTAIGGALNFTKFGN